jgi:hypothetical protein
MRHELTNGLKKWPEKATASATSVRLRALAALQTEALPAPLFRL